MSRMHRLFGVTMVEKGVSRLVSVDLGGAEEAARGRVGSGRTAPAFDLGDFLRRGCGLSPLVAQDEAHRINASASGVV
jgi:hypothetical protein